MPNFQPPNLEKRKSPGEALLAPVAQAIASYPEYKRQKELADLQHELAKRQILTQIAEHGTGAAAPMMPGAPVQAEGPALPDATGQEGARPMAAGAMVPAPETADQYRQRVGTAGLEADAKLLTAKKETQFAIPTYDKDGNVTGFTNAPAGMRLFGAGKPQQDKPAPGTAAVTNRFDGDFTKAFNFLSRIKQNKDTLQGDMAAKERKLTLGALSPTAGQGVIGTLSRKMGAGTPEQAAFATNVGKAIDIYRHDITGAAAGFSELNKLEGRLPTTEESEPNFIAKSDDTLKQGISILKSEIARAKAKGIDTTIYEQQLAELGGAGVLPDGVPTQGRIRVKNKLTGQSGTISESNFDESKYERI